MPARIGIADSMHTRIGIASSMSGRIGIAGRMSTRIGHRRRGAVLGRLISGPGVFWATGPFAEAAPIWDPKGGA